MIPIGSTRMDTGGTPHTINLPPEMHTSVGQKVGDLWALGVMLYFGTTGTRLIQAKEVNELGRI